MNFSPFGGHFPTSIPSIHQFAAKFTHEPVNGQTITENSRYHSSGANTSAGIDFPAQGISVPPSSSQNSQLSGLNSLKYSHGVHNHQYPIYNEIGCPTDLPKGLKVKREEEHNHTSPPLPPSWQSLATPGSAVADYLSHLPASTLPLSLHHFLKYSAESIKKEVGQHETGGVGGAGSGTVSSQSGGLLLGSGHQGGLPGGLATGLGCVVGGGKRKKKKKQKEKKPRPKPGEIRLTTALDGSTLYCCPECHMAYPEKELLEQHLMGHTLERRFVCDICGAGLKRKDHLTRHKQSHNPERPFVCTVCLKAFKRKEQLTLHFVIHSGEKRHICPECGKGFYRKDHLRKHTRSHLARRVKAEMSQHAPSTSTQNNNTSSSNGSSHLQGTLHPPPS